MNFALIAVLAISIAPERELVPPTVERPEPRIIRVSGADFAWLTPSAISVEGEEMGSPSMAWGHSLAFVVDPETVYTGRLGHPRVSNANQPERVLDGANDILSKRGIAELRELARLDRLQPGDLVRTI